MDTLISTALEEICSRGPTGTTLTCLWPTLTPPLSPPLKSSLWSNLLNIPSLQFVANDTTFIPNDSRIQRFEDAENLEVKIVAKEHLRDNFLGLYETPPFVIVPLQRRALERLAVARTNGITQNQLAKELEVSGKDFFYRVKKLESQKLIVRQPAIVKTKETKIDGEVKHVNTNLMFLSRYAKNLGAQQRFEINKEEVVENIGNVEDGDEGFSDDHVLVKDFLPALKAVCDKLEKANDKVLVVTDIKRELGYTGTFGHRAWRNVCNRLKNACLVEEFDAKVNDKLERCLRLLKRFSLKIFEENSSGGQDECDNEHLLKFGRRYRQTEQLFELPIDHQIYDMILAEGTKGAIGMEVSERLGLNNKRNHFRFDNLVNRFGMHRQKEFLRKTPVYRFWTSGNYNIIRSNTIGGACPVVVGEKSSVDDLNVPESSTWSLFEYNHPSPEVGLTISDKPNSTGVEFSPASTDNGKSSNMILCCSSVAEDIHVEKDTSSNAELDLASKELQTPSEAMPLTSIKSTNFGSRKTSRCLPLTSEGALREQRILEWLQDEKFILKMEMHKWLVNLEKDKSTKMDRKTVDRILGKLQNQGLCKCVSVNVPAVTNCGRNRLVTLVLHPSIQSAALDVGEIHAKLRSFKKQNHEGSSKLKNNESIPVLDNVVRIRRVSDEKTSNNEAMVANGFVLAKMPRAKLLHNFLWGYLSSSPGWDDVLVSGTLAPTCKFFSLESAINAIPVELFLQVAGSPLKFCDLTDKFKKGMHLGELPAEEYKCLKDTQATGRLSRIIDILRRLKLLRLIRDEHSEDGANVPHVTFTHAIELKPYIEEPVSVVASNFRSLDLRPRIRHDFILSSREAVDEYWKTLEYCYANADPRAALYAFPGSDPEVLHIISDKRRHLRRFHGAVNGIGQSQSLSRKRRSSENRTKSSKQNSSKCARANEKKLMGEQTTSALSDAIDQFMEEPDVSTSESDDHEVQTYHEDRNPETVDELGPEGKKECHSLISQYALSKMKQTQRTRFKWTEESDRQLVIQYVKQRVRLGAKIHRIDWTRVHDLPAPPKTCARRMASLNRKKKFRKALMKLCTILSKRYVKFLDTTCSSSSKTGPDGKSSGGVENAEEACFNEDQWDDFSDKTIKKAFEDAFCYKGIAKLNQSRKAGLDPKPSDFKTNEGNNHVKPELASSSTSNVGIGNHGLGKRKDSQQRSRSHHLHQKFVKLLNEGASIDRQVHKSLAVSNAVELLKLVFLCTSTSPELQNLLAETLRRYSEHDLFSAFSYLRERQIMIGGNGNPFILSQQFLHNVIKSPFPVNTGNRASRFSRWLQEREKELVERGIHVEADLQCGDIMQLFALVSSGEISICPCMPEEGVGEAEDLRNLKRKAEEDEIHYGDKTKKLKPLVDSELFSRREKGFPGIKLSVHRQTISIVDSMEIFRDAGTCTGEIVWKNTYTNSLCRPSSSFSFDDVLEMPNLKGFALAAEFFDKSLWEAMVGYAKHLFLKGSDPTTVCPFNAVVFRDVYTLIKKAGDQGLSMEEISQFEAIKGEDDLGHILEVLEVFGQVLKVNAYDSVRVVDYLYKSKYFLTSMPGMDQDVRLCSALKSTDRADVEHSICKSVDRIDNRHSIFPSENHFVASSQQRQAIMNDPDVHKVTILNLPEDVKLDATQNRNMHEVNLQDKDLSEETNQAVPGQSHVGENLEFSSNKFGMPVFPWINGDGTVNKVVFYGLVRQVLGTVMQNPGILEDDIIHQIDVLNPQSCRSLLELMILEKHLIVRNMHQSTSNGPPTLLGSLLGSSFKESKSVYRKHFFANPMSAAML